MSGCWCCAPAAPAAPAAPRAIYNRPSLSAIRYRVATFRSVRRALIDGVGGQSVLLPWTSRDADDYGVEILELWAYLADVLSFYQERIATEAFLRTAVQRDSLIKLAELIGYKLGPGVAATAFLAFITDPGGALTIPPGVRVQTKPAPGQLPATFETEASLDATAGLNRLRVWPVPTCTLDNYAAGVAQAIVRVGGDDLKPGQSLMFFAGGYGEEKTISAVLATERGKQITWSPSIATSFANGAEVYRFDRRFRLFGHNAPHHYTVPTTDSKGNITGATLGNTTFNQAATTVLHLESSAKDLKVNSRVLVVIRGDARAYDFNGLFTIGASAQVNPSFPPLSGVATQLTLTPAGLNAQVPAVTDIRTVQVYELTSDEISFTRQSFGSAPVQIPAGSSRVYTDQLAHPADLPTGRVAMIADATGAEQVTVAAVTSAGCEAGFEIELHPALSRNYAADSTVLYANVSKATHGETVKDETLGSGDAAQAWQTFVLQKSPVTFAPDATAPDGARDSLVVTVNAVRWTEAAFLYGHAPDERIYTTSIDENAVLSVHFGDGRQGARLPTGVNNVHARYRKGWGKAGAAQAKQITTLLDTRPGLKSVSNPAPSFGWQEPKTVDQDRQNAPTTVLTFGRAVSIRDFENLARAYPGVGKACAEWVWIAEQQAVRLTCAGGDGTSIVPLRADLLAYLNARRDPNRQLDIVDYQPIGVRLHAYVVPSADRDQQAVLAAAQQAVSTDRAADGSPAFFAFDRLNFGQDLYLSALYAALQSVPGVEAVDVVQLHREDSTQVLQSIVPIRASELATIKASTDVVIELRGAL